MPEPLRILATGAAGFVGSRVAELLKHKGHKLALILRRPEAAWRIRALLPHVESIEGDLDQPDSYRDAVKEFRPDMLIHMAWNGVTGAARNEEIQKGNVRASIALLQIALAAGAKHFIGLGSQAEYGPLNRKISETDPANPTTLYGHSKLETCLAARKICAEAGARFAWLRLFSCYGPRDNPGWLIPGLIAKMSAGEKPPLTKGEQSWDFLYIDDAAAAIVAVAETPNAAGLFNLGSGEAAPLRQVIIRLRDLIDPSAPLGFGEIPYRPDQVMHLEADIARLLEKTGWRPRTDIETGLKQTIAWHNAQK